MKTILVLFVAATGMFAQTAQVSGVVTDATSAVIPSATVTATNRDTGVQRETKSNLEGVYVIPFLHPGTYVLTVQAAGFRTFVRTGVVLETGLASTIDMRLELGQTSESVTVNAAAPLLQAETSTVSQLIERATVFNMPLSNRRATSLMRLVGNVVFSREFGAEQIPQFSVAGSRSLNQMWQLDGAATQNVTIGSLQLELNPPAESLQEFRTEINNYSAEFGRSAGGTILMTTRSGTNQFHGAGYEFFRNDAMTARTFFAPSVAPLRYNIFGASLGGPVIRNKTFFFVNYEGTREHTGTTVSTTIVPWPAEINGDFSARNDVKILDPLTRQPFPGNAIPASRIDPIGQAFANMYPAPNISGDVTRAAKANYLKNVTDLQRTDFGTARVDHTLNDNNRVFVRYSQYSTPTDTANVYPNAADFRSNHNTVSNQNIVGSWFRNLRPTLINEARYSWGNRHTIIFSEGTGSGLNGKIGLPGVDPDFLATVSVTGFSGFGAGNQFRKADPFLTQQLIDNLTWIHGKHTFKTGFEFRYTKATDDSKRSAGGSFTFSDRATGSGLASLLLGWTTSANLIYTDILNARQNYYGVYLQDDWKVTPQLTVNLGVRWELDSPRWDDNNRQSGFDPYAINPVAGVPGVVTFAGINGESKYSHNWDWNNIGPRVGLAYRLGSKLVIRTGYGISYNGIYCCGVIPGFFNGFSTNASFSSPDGGFTPAFLFRNGMPSTTREPLTPAFGAVPVGSAVRLSPDFIQSDQANGYAQQWNFSIQRELRGSMAFEAAYLGNVGHKLGAFPYSLNMIPLVDGRGPATQNQRLRPFPQFGDVTRMSPHWGNSTYHALSLKVEKRYSNGLNFLVNYNWSKFIDDVISGGELGGGGGLTHSQLHKLDKSLSGNNVPQRLVTSAVYDLPFGKGRRWQLHNSVLRAVAGGWGLGLIAEFRSGPPFSVAEQTNTSNTFSAGQRPNLVRNPSLPSDRPRAEMIAQYFDTSAYVAPGTGIFGNAPRYFGSGPGFINLDLSVHKRWPVTERVGMLLRGDCYNLPNRPNFPNPGTARGSSTFGQITSVLGGSTARQIQVSLRIEF